MRVMAELHSGRSAFIRWSASEVSEQASLSHMLASLPARAKQRLCFSLFLSFLLKPFLPLARGDMFLSLDYFSF